MKVILITGASSGIGASTALECAARGMGVILTWHRHPHAAEEGGRQIEKAGGQAVAVQLDVSRSETFPAFRAQLEALLPRIWHRSDFDVLINNAGFGLFNPIETVTESEFDSLFNVHLKGPFFLTQTLLPLLAGGGLNDEFEALLASQTALGRVGEPEDVAKAIAGLISDDSRWINAQSIEVAGGYHI